MDFRVKTTTKHTHKVIQNARRGNAMKRLNLQQQKITSQATF